MAFLPNLDLKLSEYSQVFLWDKYDLMQEFTSHHKACLAYSLGPPWLSYRSNRQLFDFKRTKLLCHKIFVCKADICAAIRLKCLLQLYIMHIQFYLRFTTTDVHYSVHYQSVTEEIKSEKHLHLFCPPMKLFTSMKQILILITLHALLPQHLYWRHTGQQMSVKVTLLLFQFFRVTFLQNR